MHKTALISKIVVSLAMGLPFLLDGKWSLALICGMTGVIWVLQSTNRPNLISSLSILIFTIFGIGSIFLKYVPIVILTNFVILLVTWDLDHYSQIYRELSLDPIHQKAISVLFQLHLKRLGLIACGGWCLGALALNIRINLSFTFGLVFVLMMIFGLHQVMRHLIQE